MVFSTTSTLSVFFLALNLSSFSFALPNPQGDPSSATPISEGSSSYYQAQSNSAGNKVDETEIRPFTPKNARLGYTIPNKSQSIAQPVQPGDIRRSRKK
jgi:hypothetical protein